MYELKKPLMQILTNPNDPWERDVVIRRVGAYNRGDIPNAKGYPPTAIPFWEDVIILLSETIKGNRK